MCQLFADESNVTIGIEANRCIIKCAESIKKEIPIEFLCPIFPKAAVILEGSKPRGMSIQSGRGNIVMEENNMGKRILFSPIGMTDPIKYCRDGSMLHICRHYLPDIVYLYLSHEMMEYHRKDNRYVDAVERLGDLLGHSFEVRLIDRDELVEVQEYDVLYQDIREELRKIEAGMDEDDELLLNMSSGTPPMKSALFIIATLAEYHYLPIQVGTPNRSANKEYEGREEYEWELNEDNEAGAPNRCTEPRHLNLMKAIKMEAVKKHVEAYDYHAALEVADEIKQDIPKETYKLIQAADARLKLNDAMISSILGGKTDSFYPVKRGFRQQIFEYALVLQVKLKKDEIADFIRGITPLTVDLLGEILKKTCGIKMEDLCCPGSRAGTMRWDRKKMDKLGILDLLASRYENMDLLRDGQIYSHQIAKIIAVTHKLEDSLLLSKVEEIVEIERAVRNMAAHEIVSVTRGWIKKETGKSVDKIFEIIKYLTVKAGINARDEDWKSYDDMNETILRQLR